MDYIIAGLGNPGKRYENSKHNIGFITLDRIAERHGAAMTRLKFKALTGEAMIAGSKAMLMKPQTYMNLSGESVLAAMEYYKMPVERLIVVYDDIDIQIGQIRIRKKGSAGTHNGMKSVIYCLQDDSFPRIRIGIGGARDGHLIDYVLGGFRRQEADSVREAVLRAADAAECILGENIEIAMSRYNAKRAKGPEQAEEAGSDE
ncbi:MAG: aminoacyl-tRNA hydrolase [Clostridiales Family XIII bacterium]|jgi:PTH1 family peptidyl-tRNA hydrolase|nr:aminoacyl-tRNA hydrolase [Clostridiales Family XIII bacterium]